MPAPRLFREDEVKRVRENGESIFLRDRKATLAIKTVSHGCLVSIGGLLGKRIVV